MNKWVKNALICAGAGAIIEGTFYGVKAIVMARRRKALEEHIKMFHPDMDEARIWMFRNIINSDDYLIAYDNDTAIRVDGKTLKYHDVYDLSKNPMYDRFYWKEVPLTECI